MMRCDSPPKSARAGLLFDLTLEVVGRTATDGRSAGGGKRASNAERAEQLSSSPLPARRWRETARGVCGAELKSIIAAIRCVR